MSANTRQVAGSHYKRGGNLQHWDMVAAMLENRYFEGCITKYATRWRFKNGAQDLEKAAHFTDKLIELAVAGIVAPMAWNTRWNVTQQHLVAPQFEIVAIRAKHAKFDMEAYYAANELTAKEIELTKRVIAWQTTRDLPAISALITGMMNDCAGGVVNAI
jgi:hypothetical protein